MNKHFSSIVPRNSKHKLASLTVVCAMTVTSLLTITTQASAKIGELYEDDDVPKVMSILQLPPTIGIDKFPFLDSIDTKTPATYAYDKFPLAQAEGQIKKMFPGTNIVETETRERWDGAAGKARPISLDLLKKGAADPSGKFKVGFVGVLDQAYPTVAMSDALTGTADRSFTTSFSVTEVTSRTSGWSIGGKVAVKVGKDAETGAEGSFSYSEMTTTSTTTQKSSTDQKSQHIPTRTVGWMQGYANGGWYAGWIVASNGSGMVQAFPVRTFYKSDRIDPPITWMQRGKELPLL